MAAELAHIATKGAQFSALAEALSQNSDFADAYVALLGAMRLNRALASSKSVLVTSSAPKEGKTTVASCLAITASLAGDSVLLIDGDLRRPVLASSMGIGDAVGLTEILFGESTVANAIHPLSLLGHSPRTTLINVNVMSGGRKSPITLTGVDWPKARMTFQAISQTFDLVLVDSPPILAANDTLLLASAVDAALLVVGAGSANLNELRRVKEQLEQTGIPLIGAVLNRFEPKIHGLSNHPYRGYNGRSRA